MLEGTAARLAAERLQSPDELARIVAAAEQLDDVVGDESPDRLVRYVELNHEYHAALAELAKSETFTRAIANASALPFASPGALLSSQASLPRSREILVVAQHQHRALIDAIRAGHGTRAEEIAREHARIALLNLEVVLEDHAALSRLRGAPLLRRVV